MEQHPTVIVTGASGGIGGALVAELLRQGYHVIGACRHPERLSPHAEFEPLVLDLGSRRSVARAAKELEGRELHAIINNAGIMPLRQTVITADGLEQTLQVNYVCTEEFTRRLLPQIHEGGVVVFTTSITRKLPRSVERAEERAAACTTPLQRFMNYARSKRLVAILSHNLAAELAPRHIRVNAADPGIVSTGIITLGWGVIDALANVFFRPFISTPQQGARSALRAFSSADTDRVFTQKKTLRQ